MLIVAHFIIYIIRFSEIESFITAPWNPYIISASNAVYDYM
jgi:hypothetical protein